MLSFPNQRTVRLLGYYLFSSPDSELGLWIIHEVFLLGEGRFGVEGRSGRNYWFFVVGLDLLKHTSPKEGGRGPSLSVQSSPAEGEASVMFTAVWGYLVSFLLTYSSRIILLTHLLAILSISGGDWGGGY